MLILSFWMMSWPYVNGDEQLLIEYGSKIKSVFLGIDKKPNRDEFIFINVAYDKQLVDKEDSLGFPIGKQDITNRKLLAQFLEILASQPSNQKFIIFDIFLEQHFDPDPCTGDTLSPDLGLQNALNKIHNIVLSYHIDGDNKIIYPAFQGHRGIASYAAVDDLFLKFELVLQDSLKSVPLLMYEYLHQTKLDQSGWIYMLNNQWIMNSIIPEFKIRQYDLFYTSPEDRYKVDNLSTMLSGIMTKEDILNYVKDRIIVMGDFEDRDIHETIYGDMGGPLILLNTYLSLVDGDNHLSGWFIAFIWLMFLFISFLLVVDLTQIKLKKQPFLVGKVNKNLKQWLSYTALLLITSICSMIFFDKYISILYLTLYLFIVKWVLSYFSRKKLSTETIN